MPDTYAPCYCGSGKKFKFCCEAIDASVTRAFELQNHKQHEAALTAMTQVTTDHPNNPAAWSQLASLCYVQGKPEQGEEALDKAFSLAPDFPFALMVRAKVRQAEGELLGALLLARKALNAYDPQVKHVVAQLYYLVFEVEMKRNCPVAGRAALEQVLAAVPTDEEVRRAYEGIFGPSSRLPMCARGKYELKKAAATRREAWNAVLGAAVPRLSDLERAFTTLTQQDASDAAAWYNLGISRAWLGDNVRAVEALEKYIDLETSERAAIDAAKLTEVLRCGQGMEEQTDYVDHFVMIQFRNMDPLSQMLNEWLSNHRMIPLQTEDQNTFTALMLELSTGGLVTVGQPVAKGGRLAAYITVVGNLLRISSPIADAFDRLREEVRQKLGIGLGELPARRGPISLHEVVAEATYFPMGQNEDQEKLAQRAQEGIAQFYEETWINRPRKSLNQMTPTNAVGSPRLRKKLLGIISFLEECAQGGMVSSYSFDRLRRKLGLIGGTPPASKATVGDITTMNAAQLTGLDASGLSDVQLEQAYQAARRHESPDLAMKFAKLAVARPASADRPDRYGLHLFLIEKGIREGQTTEALDLVNSGQSGDCEHNGGLRRDAYELLRARVHAKRGEKSQAQDVFTRLIERTPRNFEVRSQAAKAMLDMKDAAAALKFADDGVTEARHANNRDAEQMLLELSAAAKKAGA